MIAAAAPLRGHPPGLRQQPHRHELQLPYQSAERRPLRALATGVPTTLCDRRRDL